ncbi:MAG: cytochrome c biogenesis protein CcmG/thiol:disulfide interchange protein DsbE [bacterium]|jgi:cytochrome c biogenesis protein CcmG/thiol:disulfide interchange protein DsbE
MTSFKSLSFWTNRKFNLFTIFVIASLFLFAGCNREKRVLAVGKKAPKLAVLDLKGNVVKVSDFKNKVVLLQFWQRGCNACLKEMPELNKLYKKYKKDGLVIIGISFGTSEKYVQKTIKKLKLIYPLTMDQVQITKKKYQIMGVPTLYLIDQKGVLQKTFVGATPMKILEKSFLPLLTQQS